MEPQDPTRDVTPPPPPPPAAPPPPSYPQAPPPSDAPVFGPPPVFGAPPVDETPTVFETPSAYQAPTYPPPPSYPPPASPYAVAATPLSPEQERTWGMLAHAIPAVCMVLSAGTLGFVGSLVVYLLYKDRGQFVRAHAANSLNVQIMTAIILVVSVPLMLILVGFLTYGLALLVALIIHIVGATRANRGEWFSPPLTPAFVK